MTNNAEAYKLPCNPLLSNNLIPLDTIEFTENDC